jgi:rare lipoprotein A
VANTWTKLSKFESKPFESDKKSVRNSILVATIFIFFSQNPLAQAKTSQKPRSHHQQGMASWYGLNHQGKRTANGEKFDMNALTAAHRTLPMNSVVQVKSLRTGKTVQVRINDRGPFARGRIIDISKAAAQKIGMMKRGTDKVELTVISSPRKPASRSVSKIKKSR